LKEWYFFIKFSELKKSNPEVIKAIFESQSKMNATIIEEISKASEKIDLKKVHVFASKPKKKAKE